MARQRYVKGVDEVPRRLHDIDQQLKEFMPSVAGSQANLIKKLQEVADNYYTEFSTAQTGFTGWETQGRVYLTSSTGHIEITYGGSLRGGDGYFCYSVSHGGIDIVSRESIRSNPARCVAISGSASFATSGFGHTVIDVPVGEPLTVALELYTEQSSTYFFGGSLLAKVAL